MRPRVGRAEVEADLAVLTGQAPAAEAGADDDDGFRVFAEGWPVLTLFLALDTQWQRAGLAGVPTGLRYEAIPVAAQALGIALDAWTFEALREMELAALAVWADKAAREHDVKGSGRR